MRGTKHKNSKSTPQNTASNAMTSLEGVSA